MYDNIFKTMTDQTEKAMAPFIKYNQLVVKNVEEATQIQLEALKACVDTSVEQLKGASEISDMQSLIEFNVKQVEAITSLSQKMIEDGKKIAKIGQDFKTEIEDLTSETMAKATAVA